MSNLAQNLIFLSAHHAHIDDAEILLAEADLTLPQLLEDIEEANIFIEYLNTSSHQMTKEKGLVSIIQPEWATHLVRRNGVVAATIEKAGSRSFVKRRPDNAKDFEVYVQKQYIAQQPLLFRVGFGPLKNVNRYGYRQDPDLAEYLAITQLSRFLEAIACLYPYGVKAQIIPDDLRSCSSNSVPETYARHYIFGLQNLVEDMNLSQVISVEPGQKKFYEQYNVLSYREQAKKSIEAKREADPEAFAASWDRSLKNAGKNLLCTKPRSLEDIEASAWNYLIAHGSEVLSGLWSPGDAFPLRYANHVNSYQIFTLGHKKTKLPWQIQLPVSLANSSANIRRIFNCQNLKK